MDFVASSCGGVGGFETSFGIFSLSALTQLPLGSEVVFIFRADRSLAACSSLLVSARLTVVTGKP